MSRSRTAWWAVFILIALPSLVLSQKAGEGDQRPSCNAIDSNARSQARPTSARWRIVRNGDHPSWPSRLILVPGDALCQPQFARTFPLNSSRGTEHVRRTPIVRVNDVLTISEDTSSLHVSLEGVALNDGSAGDEIKVRLRLAGTIMRARVIARGQASLMQKADEVHR